MDKILDFKTLTDGTIEVVIKLNLNFQNYYHFEKAISNHIEAGEQRLERLESQTKEDIEKYGDNKERHEYLIGFMYKLRDELRQKFNLNCGERNWN